jgi:hypothetical protein
VAVKFNHTCGDGYPYPYCFEEGPGYVAEAGPTNVHATVPSVGDSASSSVEDNYALAWVELPSSAAEYNVTLANTSGGGQLRGTVACDTGSELRLSPLPDVAASGGASTLAGFNPVGCTTRVLVVTNESQTAANPTSSASRTFSVSTATASGTAHTLSVTRTGAGKGTVTSNDAGISCGGDCSQTYPSGTSVTLTATPAPGSNFAGWSGPCSGTGQCTVTMSESRSVMAAFTLIADTTAPQTSITAGPTGSTSDSTPTFTFTSSEPGSTFTCQIDSSAAVACGSPYTTGVLADGPHTFSVYARDMAGNPDTTPATRAFTVAAAPPADQAPPVTTITDGPSGITLDATPTFAFSSDEANSSFVCQIDQSLPAPCTSPHTTEQLAAGFHVFSVYAIDAAGNRDPTPATREFTVAGGDRVAPTISVLRVSRTRFRAASSGPAISAAVGTRISLTLSEAATVTFRVKRVRGRRAVLLRGRIVRDLARGTNRLRYRGRLANRKLRAGRYLLVARARDDAGNLSSRRSVSFTIVR